jgi:hypothetical protein
MSSEPNPTGKPGQNVIERASKERRRFRRVKLAITGRLYITATQEEALCTVNDISPGDVSVLCELKQEPKGRAVIYLESFGRFEGPIVRQSDGGLAMTFSCSLQKRERLADQLTLEVNRHLLKDADLRRYDRVEAVSGSYTHFTRSSGEHIRCEVLDLSLSGVSVRTELRPPVGEHILIGHRAGRVARHHKDGIGVEFLGLALNVTETALSLNVTPPSRPTLKRKSVPAESPAPAGSDAALAATSRR